MSVRASWRLAARAARRAGLHEEAVQHLEEAQKRLGASEDVLLEWAGGVEVDESRLQQDLGSFVDQYRGVPLKDLRIGLMLGEVTALLQQDKPRTLPASQLGRNISKLSRKHTHGILILKI